MKEFLLFLAFSLGFGILIFKKLPQYRLLDRYIAAAIPAVSFILILSVLNQILVAPFFAWNPIRLAPTFALTHGYQLYYGADNGPILSTIYGPITALAYLPATLAISPNSAVIVGSFISATFFFIPIILLFVSESFHESKKVVSLNRSQKLLFSIYGFYAFVGFFMFAWSRPLFESAFPIHADAISLGLGGAACCFLYFRKQKNSFSFLLLSAIMIILSIWAKQIAVPLLIALPTYVLLADGFKCFKRYVLCICISGVIISTILLIIFNPQLTFLNIFIIPGNHPWRVPGSLSDVEAIALLANNREIHSNKLDALVVAGKELIQYCLLPVVIIFLGILYQFLFLPSISKKKFSEWLSYNRWTMLLIVCLFMIPSSLLSRVKVGGAYNGFSFTLYFLVAAATLLVFRLILDSVSVNTISWRSFTISNFLILVLITTFFLNNISNNVLKELNNTLQQLPNSPRQLEYNSAKLHPNEVYFPWNPLSSLMAEGKLYHYEFGLEDRLLGGYPVSNEHFRSYIPSNINKVAFLERNDGYVMKLLPEFSKKVEDDDLPGWTVYTQE